MHKVHGVGLHLVKSALQYGKEQILNTLESNYQNF